MDVDECCAKARGERSHVRIAVRLAVVVWFCIAVLCLAVLGAGEGAETTSPSAQIADWTAWFKDVATITALLAGAYWFLRRRERFPRLNLDLDATLASPDQERQMARVRVELENVGEVMAKLVCAEVWLQQLEPRDPEAIASIVDMEETIRDSRSPSAEALWPSIGKRVLVFEKGQREIEPGEQDEICFDFLVEKGVRSVLVYVHIENAAKSRSPFTWWKRRDIGWNVSKVVTKGGEIDE